MTDKELADAVQHAEFELQRTIREAYDAGLKVDVDVTEFNEFGRHMQYPVLDVRVYRPL